MSAHKERKRESGSCRRQDFIFIQDPDTEGCQGRERERASVEGDQPVERSIDGGMMIMMVQN